MSRQRVIRSASVASLLLLLFLGDSALTARQEPAKEVGEPRGAKPPEKRQPAITGEVADENDAEYRAAERTAERQLEAYDVKPHPRPAIPDDPPPHEGAMIDYPMVIEPPDLLLVEVLEALPGRPISGERLVRYDGTIGLGFYGDVHVAGLTIPQAKVKIMQHLRRYLNDEVLGLFEVRRDTVERAREANPAGSIRAVIPPPGDGKPEPTSEPGTKASGAPPRIPIPTPPAPEESAPRAVRGTGGRRLATAAGPVRRIIPSGRRRDQDQARAEDPPKEIKVPLEGGGKVTITIDARAGAAREDEQSAPTGPGRTGVVMLSSPVESERVFVDITAYNSEKYYVVGDVPVPGKLPFTGRDTVLDAIQYAGNLLPTADPKNIRLVRPPRGGKPAKVLEVDLEAIRERGDPTTNYQIFPGDRLVVGRNEVVKKTIELDRLASPLQIITNAISQESNLLRSLKTASPENAEAILRGLVDFWIEQIDRPEGARLDAIQLREALLKRLLLKP